MSLFDADGLESARLQSSWLELGLLEPAYGSYPGA